MVQAQTSLEPVILADESGLTVDWSPPSATVTTVDINGDSFSQIQMPGINTLGRPGRPQLPVFGGLIGLPPSGDARLKIVRVEQQTISLPHPPLPAAVPQPVRSLPTSPPTGLPTRHTPDPTIYQADDLYPVVVAELGSPQQLRYQRVARLTIYPARVNPVTRQLTLITSLRLEISFDEPADRSPAVQGQADAFAKTLAPTLLNPIATDWAIAPPVLTPQHSLTAQAADNATKIIIDQPGLYAVDYNDLQQAGLPVDTLDPRTLQMTYGWPRTEIAILVEGEADGRFDPADRLLFFAEPAYSRFTDEAVYFLQAGQANGLRMTTTAADPAGLPPGTAWRTVDAEINQHYDPKYVDHQGDYWYWTELRQPNQTSADFSLTLDAPFTGGPDALLTVRLQGVTLAPHWVSVSWNGVTLGQHQWNGDNAVEINFPVQAHHLQSGVNQINVSLPSSSDAVEIIWVDAFSLTYPISGSSNAQLIFSGETGPATYTLPGWAGANLNVYDITSPDAPVQLSGYQLTANGGSHTLRLGNATNSAARYLVVPQQKIKQPVRLEALAALPNLSGGADYIIITHPDFAAATAPLAAHRAAQNMRVVTVNINAIYDHFGEGRMNPAAIKTFLQAAFATWPSPAPTYLLLVGDGSYDFRNYGQEVYGQIYSNYDPKNFIPPFMAPVDPWWGETATDNQFVTLNGNTMPDMLVGRLAVNSAAQTATVVDKIVQYETNPAPGDWNGRHLFVSDIHKYDLFINHADEGYNQTVAPFSGYRYYYDNPSPSQSYIYPSVDMLRTAMLSAINQGAGFVTFHGHGAWLQWAPDGILRYYPNPPYPSSYPNDLNGLSNQYRLPVILELTCFTASFHRPEYSTIDESLLNLPGGGAVAVWGSTGQGVATGHTSLQAGFHEALNQGQTHLGALTLAAKNKLYATGYYPDLLDTYLLLGDPALTINTDVPELSNQIYLPVILH